MKIKNILVSQPAPAFIEKSPFNEIIRKHHVEIKFQPFIKVERVSLKEFRGQRVEILDHTAVIFTSRTTIDSFFHICEEARINIPETMKYFCNTEAVALYLQKYIVYRKRKIFFADGSFANFMELILKHKSEKFLLTLSDPHKPEMPMAMEKLKLKFDKAILARTVGADLTGLDIQQYDMLVFYSPSEISTLVSKFSVSDLTPRVATFGHGTTKAAIGEGLTVHVMAPTPQAPSMTKALELYIQQIEAGEEVPTVTLEGDSPDQAYIQSREVRGSKRRSVSNATETNSSKSASSPITKPGKSSAKTSAGKSSSAKASTTKTASVKSATVKSVAASSGSSSSISKPILSAASAKK